MLANSLLPPILNFFFDPDFLIYLLKKLIAKFKKARGTITQEEFNKAYEYPEIDMIERYSSVYLILLLGFTFSPVLPHVALIGIVGLILMYVSDKYIITKRTSILTELSGDLFFFMTCHFDYLLLVFCLSDYLWDKFYIEGSNGYEKSVGLKLTIPIILILYKVLPIATIIREAYNFKKVKNSSITYREMQAQFGEEKNYENDNPTVYLH